MLILFALLFAIITPTPACPPRPGDYPAPHGPTYRPLHGWQPVDKRRSLPPVPPYPGGPRP